MSDEIEAENAEDLLKWMKTRLTKKIEESKTLLQTFYSYERPSEDFREDLLKCRAGLQVVFEKLLIHALGKIQNTSSNLNLQINWFLNFSR